MKIAPDLLDEVIAHALDDPKNEVCGVVAVDAAGAEEGRVTSAVEVHRAVNVHASPLKFEIDPTELLALYNTIDEQDLELGAIYHSHTRSEPYPSQTDINFAKGWPGVLWIIVGLADEQPKVRTFAIAGGEVSETELEVV